MGAVFVIVSLISVALGIKALMRKDYRKLVVVLFFLLTDGFGIVPSGGGFLSYSNVGIVLMLYCILVLKAKGKVRFCGSRLEKVYTVFGVYLLVCIGFSLIHYGFAPFEIFRVVKWLIPFGLVFLFRLLDEESFAHIFKLLLCLTVFLNVIYIVQCFTGIAILSYHVDNVSIGESGFARFYNKPVFSTFFLLLLLFGKMHFLSARTKAFSIVVMIASLVLSLNRLEIGGFIIAYLFCLFSGNSKVVTKVKHSVIILLFSVPVMFVMSMRDEGGSVSALDDIMVVLNGDFTPEKYDSGNGGTFAFRFAMIAERLEYMFNQSASEIAFGLGLGHSDYIKVQKLYNFRVGTFTADGGVGQLSSADFAWTGMICQWGLAGTIIFMWVFCAYMSFFHRNIKRMSLGLVSYAYLLYLLVWSFAGSTFSQAQYYFMPAMSYFYLLKCNNKKIENESNPY